MNTGSAPSKMFEIQTCHAVTQTVKNLPAMQETRLQPLGREDPLEEGIAAHSRILAWRSPWTEEPGRLPQGCKKSDTTEVTQQQHM